MAANDPLRTERDLEEILARAVREDVGDSATLRERLAQTAAEIGITPEALERAEAQWLRERDRAQFEIDFRAKKRKSLIDTLGGLITASGICLVVDWFTGGSGLSWSLIPVGIMGVIMLGNLVEAAFSKPNDRDFDSWSRRQKRRQKRSEDAESG
ncbi:MAG TPA: hypothetical protein PLH94_04675 [Fimbriimonadaceae bacterium]|nr:hypothetical protein [Fimbriimonadaceae bacterium]